MPVTIGRARTEAARAALRASRRDLRKEVNKTIVGIVERRVVPTANAMAPNIVKGSMVGRANTKGAWLTTNWRGKRRAIVAVLNFGGTIKVPIVPKRKKALHWVGPEGDVFTLRVTKPRVITGKHWMETAARLHAGSVRIAIAREVPAAIQAHIDRGA